jgi:predicted dehydrogenase
MESGKIGIPFRARIDMISGFPLFENQPFLRELEQYILTDLGSHILDVARFLFGEAQSLLLPHAAHSSRHKGRGCRDRNDENGQWHDRGVRNGLRRKFPRKRTLSRTFIFIEGSQGSIELGPDYWIRITTKDGTHARRYAPPRYDWADPAYDIVHASIVPCNADLLGALRGEHETQTSGDDNLKTVELVFASYESAANTEYSNSTQAAPQNPEYAHQRCFAVWQE